MAGSPDIWNYENIDNENINKLYSNIIDKIDNFIDEYSDDEIDIIQIMFIELNPLPKLKLNNINQLKLDKKIIKIGETQKIFSNQNLPLTMDLKYYGEKLKYKLNNQNYIDTIICNGKNIYENIVYDFDDPNLKGGSKFILDRITDDIKINIFLYSIKFKPKFTEKEFKLRYKIFIVKDSNRLRNIEVFNINEEEIDHFKDRLGKPKMLITDISLNKDNSEFIRTINDFTLHINNSKIIKFEHKIKLPVIKHIIPNNEKTTRNYNIGTLDIETYFDKDLNKSITYAIGYKVFNNKSKLFYKNDNQTSDELILECIDSLLQKVYSGYTFYVHNLHGYDSFFILKVLLEFNKNNNDYYKINTIFRDNRIIKLTISSKVGKTKDKLILIRSLTSNLPSNCEVISKTDTL